MNGAQIQHLAGMGDRFDPTDPRVVADPYPDYRRFRESDPVHLGTSPDPRFERSWFVFSFDAANDLLRDRTLKSDPRGYLPDGTDSNDPPRLSITDPPDHTRQRSVLTNLFRKSTVNGYREQIRDLATQTLTELRQLSEPDLVRDFAFKIPIGTIASLLGLPGADHERLRDWSGEMMAAFDLGGDLEHFAAAEVAIANFDNYFDELVHERMGRAPLAGQGNLLDGLIEAAHAGELTPAEVVAMCRFLVIAGFETTMNLIGTGFYELTARPDQKALVLADLDGVMPGAVQELLRHISPVQRLMARFSDHEVEVGDKLIPAGDPIYIMVGAANRDPSAYASPDEIDVTRDASRHLAFGFGRHICVGALLARIEGEESLRVLLTEGADLEVDTDREVRWRRMALARGLDKLPIKWPGLADEALAETQKGSK